MLQSLDLKKINFSLIEKEILIYKNELTIKNHPNKIRKEKIISALSIYIYYFPRLFFRIGDEDLLSEFYVYVLDRVDKVLEKYNHQISSLSTYLGIRLRTYWLNFITSTNQQEKLSFNYQVDLKDLRNFSNFNRGDNEDKRNKENVLELNEENLFSNDHLDNFFFHTFYFQKKKFINLDEPRAISLAFKYLVMKLYYFDFFHDEDFILLKKYLGYSYGKTLKVVDDFREKLFLKRSKKSQGEEKLAISFYKFSKLSESNFKEKTEQKTLTQKYLNQLKQQKRKLDEYYKIKNEPTIKEVALVLNEKNERKIWNIIQYQKKVAKDNLENLKLKR